MRVEGRIYCDGPDCEINAHIGPDRFNEAGKITSLPPGFVRVEWSESDGYSSYSFCGTECLMKWAAKFPPPEIIPAGEPDA